MSAQSIQWFGLFEWVTTWKLGLVTIRVPFFLVHLDGSKVGPLDGCAQWRFFHQYIDYSITPTVSVNFFVTNIKTHVNGRHQRWVLKPGLAFGFAEWWKSESQIGSINYIFSHVYPMTDSSLQVKATRLSPDGPVSGRRLDCGLVPTCTLLLL